MVAVLLIGALLTGAAAAALLYAASPQPRWLAVPLPAFPARVSAALCAIVSLRASIEVLGANAGMLGWLILLASFGIVWLLLDTPPAGSARG